MKARRGSWAWSTGRAVDHRRLADLDLNLLVVLDALLEERSVGRAGRVLGLSQPATSRALARLRARLDDPLLVRAGATMVLTPRAEALRVPLRRLLNGAAAVLEPPATFDPARSSRVFVVAATDYVELVLLVPMLAELRAAAPGVCMVVRPAVLEQVGRAETGDVDLGLAPLSEEAPGLRRRRLWRDRFVVAFRPGHPLEHQPLTLAQYVQWPQVLVSPEGRGTTAIDTVLAQHDRARTIAHRTPSLCTALALVERSDLVVNLPALAMAYAPGLRTAELPFECPPLDVHLIRHERSVADPGLEWLIERLVAAASGLRGASEEGA